MTALEVLKQYFGYDAFRSGQETLINSMLSGRDVLGIMPTGAGKSICFQIPALILNGLTLIISPLISLMKDQVNALTQSGIKAAFINSSLNERQIYKALENARNGVYKLIYVAPERLLTPNFISFAQTAEISMLTVDEAHCISQWGQDFRPSYSKIPEFVNLLQKRPIVSAFTATATPNVREDIVNLLRLKNHDVLVTGFDRQNLFFQVKKPQDKFLALTSFLKDREDQSGIVYCLSRATVEEVCEKLNQVGYKASRYHAGLSDVERHSNQDDFLYDRVQIMVATNAFGMGIDKPDVSFVVHFNMPKDIESYYQEAGRAGRDGESADCVLLYGAKDVHINSWLIENSRDVEYPDAETERILKERDRRRLRKMTFYCTTGDCLRGYILKYFGEKPPDYCGNCGNCNTVFETQDITVEAQKIISCVIRMKENYGTNMVIEVLRGSKNERIMRLGFDKLSTYGISERTTRQLRQIINYLILNGYLLKTNDEYPVLKRGKRASEVLRNNTPILMKLPKETEQNSKESEPELIKTAVKPVDKRLFTLLRELRSSIANEQSVPAFVIFTDSTLTDMCIKLPKTKEELLGVTGVGKVKLEQYGKQFLKVISEFTENNIISETPPPPAKEFDFSSIEISEEPVTINTLADKINCVLLESGYLKVSGQKINDWLITKGYMELINENNKNFKIPTIAGEELGIMSEERIIRGEPAKMNLYKATAQSFIAQNILKIIKFKK